jgi:hypothetical protein
MLGQRSFGGTICQKQATLVQVTKIKDPRPLKDPNYKNSDPLKDLYPITQDDRSRKRKQANSTGGNSRNRGKIEHEISIGASPLLSRSISLSQIVSRILLGD